MEPFGVAGEAAKRAMGRDALGRAPTGATRRHSAQEGGTPAGVFIPPVSQIAIQRAADFRRPDVGHSWDRGRGRRWAKTGYGESA